jgi:threonine synthase
MDIMQNLNQTGKYEVTDEIKAKISKDFYANFANEEETLSEINYSYKEKAYLMDTHTAVASNVLEKYRNETNDQAITIIASTANPYKFNESVLKALNVKIGNTKDEFELLELLKKSSNLEIPKELLELQTKEKRFNGNCNKENMIDIVTKFVG